MCATQSNIFPGALGGTYASIGREDSSPRRSEQYPLERVRYPLSLPKSRRILRSSEFREIYRSGFRMTSRYFAAFCFQRAEEQAGSTRAGFTIPRAVGKAVIR